MITSAKNYTKINIKIRNKSVAGSKPQVYSCSQSPPPNSGLIHCLFRYSTDAGYIKLIVGILSAASEVAWRNFPFSCLFAQLLGFSFGFGPASARSLPSGFCSRPDRRGLKQWPIRGLWLTHARGREGYSSYYWNVGRACGGRGRHDIATA